MFLGSFTDFLAKCCTYFYSRYLIDDNYLFLSKYIPILFLIKFTIDGKPFSPLLNISRLFIIKNNSELFIPVLWYVFIIYTQFQCYRNLFQ